jgi:uncharacterized protein YtpQ (UPF0354 family)
MRIVVLALALLAACGGSPPPATASTPVADDPPVDASTEDALTASAARILAAHLPDATITTIEPLLLRVGTAEVSLDKPWRSCEQEPSSCDGYTREYLRRIAATFTGDASASGAALRAIVRNRAFVDTMQARVGGVLVVEPLAADLAVVYVVDRPESTKFLVEDDLAAMKLTRADAIARARQNVAAHLGRLETRAVPDHALGALATGEYYETSRLLDHAGWKDVAASMPSGLIVVAPANDVLLYGDASAEGRAAMGTIAADMASKAEIPVSATVLRWTDAGWVAD